MALGVSQDAFHFELFRGYFSLFRRCKVRVHAGLTQPGTDGLARPSPPCPAIYSLCLSICLLKITRLGPGSPLPLPSPPWETVPPGPPHCAGPVLQFSLDVTPVLASVSHSRQSAEKHLLCSNVLFGFRQLEALDESIWGWGIAFPPRATHQKSQNHSANEGFFFLNLEVGGACSFGVPIA